METEFLGHSVGYWLELQKRIDTIRSADLLQEVVNLRGKVAFYESRIKEMNEIAMS